MHDAHRTAADPALRPAIAAHVAATAGPRYDALLAELRQQLAIIEAGALLTGGAQGSAFVGPSYGSASGVISSQGCVAVWPAEADLDAAARKLLALVEAAAPTSATIIPFPTR